MSPPGLSVQDRLSEVPRVGYECPVWGTKRKVSSTQSRRFPAACHALGLAAGQGMTWLTFLGNALPFAEGLVCLVDDFFSGHTPDQNR